MNTGKSKKLTVIILILIACVFGAIAYTYMDRFTEPDKEAGDIEDSISSSIKKAVLADETVRESIRETVQAKMAASHVYSHRGNGIGVEEHSLAGYDKAIEDGAMFIEQDVVASADGTLYVSHDTSAERLTGTSAYYSGMTDDQIDSLTTHGGNHILKLGEVFDHYGDKVTYVVELKSKDSIAVESFISLVGQYGNESSIIVQCFSLDVLEQLEEVFPDMIKLFLCQTTDGVSEGLKSDCVDIISVDKRIMSEDLCKKVHDAGKQFSVWTVDTDSEIISAINIGADTYFTNNIPLALEMERQYRKP